MAHAREGRRGYYRAWDWGSRRICVRRHQMCVKSVCRTIVQTSTDAMSMAVPPVEFAMPSLARMPHGQCA